MKEEAVVFIPFEAVRLGGSHWGDTEGNLWSVNMYYCDVNLVGRVWWSSKQD